MEAGNGVATDLFIADNVALNTQRLQDYALAAVNENDQYCNFWVAKPSTANVKFAKQIMLDPQVRQASAARIKKYIDTTFELTSEVIEKPIIATASANSLIFNATTFPNLYGSFAPASDAVGLFPNGMWDKGLKTVAFLREQDNTLNNVYGRAGEEYLA